MQWVIDEIIATLEEKQITRSLAWFSSKKVVTSRLRSSILPEKSFSSKELMKKLFL